MRQARMRVRVNPAGGRCRRWGLVSSLLGSSLIAGPAAAHVCLELPVSRAGPQCSYQSPQKVGPCGANQRSDNPTVFRPGETITVRIRETIDHPSHYRIAFNPDGDAFEDPVDIDDKQGDHPHVLADGIEDVDAAVQEVQVTLPDVTCETCTLQLIQVMYDKQGNGFGGNDGVPPDNDDLYYMCADIVLRGDPAGASGGGAETDGAPGDAGADDDGMTGAGVDPMPAQPGSGVEPEAAAGDPDNGGCTLRPLVRGRGAPGLLLLLGATLWSRRRGRSRAAGRRPPTPASGG